MIAPPKIYMTYFGEIKSEEEVESKPSIKKAVINIIDASDIEINYWFETNWTKFINKNVVNGLDRGVLNAIFSQRERFLDIIRIITYNAKGIEKYSLYELNFFKDFNLEERPLSKKPIRERTPKTPIKKESTQTSQLSLFD